MAEKIHSLNFETLESRTLFAGLNDTFSPETELIEVQVEDVECEGFFRQVGEALVSVGSSMEAPGQAVQSLGESIHNYFAEIPEYPSGGVYKGLSVDVLSGLGSIVATAGFIPNIVGTGISCVGALGEMLGDDGGYDDVSFSNSIRNSGEALASLGEWVTEWGIDFSDAQRYAPEYADFVAEHEDSWITIAGTSTGALVSATGFAMKLPGLAVHKTGDLTIKTCDIASATNQVLNSAYASVSDFYHSYFASGTEAVS